ncbi:glutamate--putrescine ligase [Modicisalibacter ilicicola DSM 19980]|uniref:Glutamate--putrescine ligase n=1 Tax=Modicisalibacter ilicicola DSM 19980 TaxID=1121942 RepID=A0A1M4ZS92_9GAMM|nr:glutamine synthetase family protein [Halomonas ilicicola]SHF20878.1 glutamate--putrescine ligase [Halomonas ilicicola DSM 19980]
MQTATDSTDTKLQASSAHNERIEVLCVDMNGIPRGKWVPADQLDKVMNGKVRLPLSTQSLDIWGADNDELTGLSQSIGDPDGECRADERTLVPLPWASASQVLTTLHALDGSPSFMDPRGILANVVERFHRHGWTPVVAIELEFYLLDADWRHTGHPSPPRALCPGGVPKGLQLYELDAMDALDDVLNTIRDYAVFQRVPADTLIAEFGPGQFEVNLWHREDALAAADDALYFKRLVAQAARRHDLASTFMAKPYTEQAGSGMHLHVSVIDDAGHNILDRDNGAGHLEAAVGGVMQGLLEAQAVFAPHANSYRRFQPDCFAPIECNWGYDHRGAAVRIPECRGPAARLEHRVAGADANPYLVTAALLGGMLQGLEQRIPPPPAIDQNEASQPLDRLTHDWLLAIERFAASDAMADILGTAYRDLYAKVKRHEAQRLLATVTDIDHLTYLTRL